MKNKVTCPCPVCGRARMVEKGKLRSSQKKRCQRCYWDSLVGVSKPLTHGEANKTPEYSAWKAMRRRCNSPSAFRWKYYGARGITVCERWAESFENFLADMGRKPTPKHSLDRINNDGNYEPGNCRWATRSEQNKNRRPFSPGTRKGIRRRTAP